MKNGTETVVSVKVDNEIDSSKNRDRINFSGKYFVFNSLYIANIITHAKIGIPHVIANLKYVE